MIARFRAAAPDFPPAEYENVFTNARGERLVIAWQQRAASRRHGQGRADRRRRPRHHAAQAAGGGAARLARAASSRRATTSGAGSSATCTTARSSGWSRSRWRCGWRRRRSASDPAAARELLDGASEELAQALDELRELARGIHPAVLTDRGLRAALEGLAARTPLPVELDLPDERLPEPIEAAAYYVVAEAVTNVVKHADASAVEVRVTAIDGSLVIEVADDGVGAADPETGSGLRGLADRLAALDGRLRVESPPSGGTRVVAEIPLPAIARPEPERRSRASSRGPRPRPCAAGSRADSAGA